MQRMPHMRQPVIWELKIRGFLAELVFCQTAEMALHGIWWEQSAQRAAQDMPMHGQGDCDMKGKAKVASTLTGSSLGLA